MSSTPSPEWPGRGDALAFARLLLRRPGSVVEIRAPRVRRGHFTTNASGYFDDPAELVAAVASIDGDAESIYITLNPVRRDLLARAANRLVLGAKQTTGDSDVVARRFLGLDFDPARPSGISSSDEEKAAAHALANEVRVYLESVGFPDPIEGDSGN
ncbi:MAG TPA: hypothetical protein VFM30_11260, partial [Steroidobacteraceae bacterium]|nr:hypothetical protein [Steroidobacteraceae bacterium]